MPDNFYGVTPESSLSWVESATDGLSNSGAVDLPVEDGLSEVWISKTGFAMEENSTFVAGAYFYNASNGGSGLHHILYQQQQHR